jgi:hypothetical protein
MTRGFAEPGRSTTCGPEVFGGIEKLWPTPAIRNREVAASTATRGLFPAISQDSTGPGR